MFLLSHFHGDSARKDVLRNWKKKEKRESGWDNHQTVGRKETTAKKYGYAPHMLLKPTFFKNELEKMEGLSAQIEHEKVQYFNQPKPMPSYFSIAASLGLVHHDNTDVNKELDVVKRIIARESLLITLEMLCRKLVRWEALQRTTTDLENDLLLTLADMRDRTVEYIDALIVWRESAVNHDPLNPRIFYWEQRNYTLKITKDMDFLADQPLFVNALGIPLEKIKTNPLMLPNTLEETEVTWIDPVQRAVTDAGGMTVGDVFNKRLRVRIAERVLLMEIEMAAEASTLQEQVQVEGQQGGMWDSSPLRNEQQGKYNSQQQGYNTLGIQKNVQTNVNDMERKQLNQMQKKSLEYADYTDQERRDVAYLNWHLEAQLSKELYEKGSYDQDDARNSTNDTSGGGITSIQLQIHPPSDLYTVGGTSFTPSDVPSTGSRTVSKAATTAGTEAYTPFDENEEKPPSMGRSYTPYGVKASDDDDDPYASDAFDSGDNEALDPFRKFEDGKEITTTPAAPVAPKRPNREIHAGGVDSLVFETEQETDPIDIHHANPPIEIGSTDAVYEAYNMHEVFDPITAAELERLASVNNPPPRIRLAAAGIVILLSRLEGEEIIPTDVSFRVFQRFIRNSGDFVAASMNAIVPNNVARAKLTALESYMHILNAHDNFPGWTHLTPHDIEIGNKLCKWVVLVVSAARANMESQRESNKHHKYDTNSSKTMDQQPQTYSPPHAKNNHAGTHYFPSSSSQNNNQHNNNNKINKYPSSNQNKSSHSKDSKVSKLEPGQLPVRSMAQLGQKQQLSVKSMAQLPKLTQSPTVATKSRSVENFKKVVKSNHNAGGKGSIQSVNQQDMRQTNKNMGLGRQGKIPSLMESQTQGNVKGKSSTPMKNKAGKEMWPVHSELIEMGLHVHPVLLTLASTLKDGVVSMEDGLLAKAYDLVDSQEAMTTIDIREYNAYLQYLQSIHSPEAVYSVFQPLNVDWWAHALRHIVEIIPEQGSQRMMLRVSQEILERFVLDRIQGQGLVQDQEVEIYQPLSEENFDGNIMMDEDGMDMDGNEPPPGLLRGVSQITVSDDGSELEAGQQSPSLMRGVSQIVVDNDDPEMIIEDTYDAYEADVFDVTVQPSVLSIPASPPLSVQDDLSNKFSSSRNGSPVRAMSAPMSEYDDEGFEELSDKDIAENEESRPGSFEESRVDKSLPAPVVAAAVAAVPVTVKEEVVENFPAKEKGVEEPLESLGGSAPLPSESHDGFATIIATPTTSVDDQSQRPVSWKLESTPIKNPSDILPIQGINPDDDDDDDDDDFESFVSTPIHTRHSTAAVENQATVVPIQSTAIEQPIATTSSTANSNKKPVTQRNNASNSNPSVSPKPSRGHTPNNGITSPPRSSHDPSNRSNRSSLGSSTVEPQQRRGGGTPVASNKSKTPVGSASPAVRSTRTSLNSSTVEIEKPLISSSTPTPVPSTITTANKTVEEIIITAVRSVTPPPVSISKPEDPLTPISTTSMDNSMASGDVNRSLLITGDLGGTTPTNHTGTPGSDLEDDSGSPKAFKLPIMSRQSTMRKELTLHDVAKRGKLKDVQVFVAKKVDLNELDRHGVTPIFYAVAQGHLEVVRYLADNGADIATKTKADGYTLLYIACLGGHLPLVKYLLNEKRADKDEKINNGATPMTAATEAGHEAVVKYLESFDASNKMDTGRVGTIGEEAETSSIVVSTTRTLIVPDSPGADSFSTPRSPVGVNRSLLTVGDMGSTLNSRSQTPDSSFDDSGSPKGFKPPIMSRQSTMRKERTLHDVAKLGKLKDVQMFVAKNVDLNELDRHGVTPIFYAVAQGHLEVVRYLADNGADTASKTKADGYTLLYIACLGGHLPLVKYLLNEKHADKGEKINNGATPMTAATEAGHEAVVKYLESFDAPNKMDTGRVGTIKEEAETSTTALIIPDSPSKTPISAAGSPSKTPDSSLDDGGSPKSFKPPIMSRQSTMRKELTLHDVAKQGKLKDVQVFVAKKVDLNELDRHGVTPIFYAVAQGHLEVVRYLADNGADTTTKTKADGYTLLYIACLGGHLPLVKYLLNEKRADKDEKINNGATPMTAATEAGHEAVAKYLESFDVANIDNGRSLPIAEE